MKHFCLALVSDATGRADAMALMSIAGMISFIGLELFAVIIRHQMFEPERFGMGLGSALAAGAIGMGLKTRFGG